MTILLVSLVVLLIITKCMKKFVLIILLMAVKFAAFVASYLWFHSLLYHKDIRRYCITRYLSLKIFRELYLCSLCGLHKKKTRRPEKDRAPSRVGKKKT